MLGDTLLFTWIICEPIIFCIGVVLLFAKERHRQPHPLDWTRRWGILGSSIVALLSAVNILFLPALIAVAISAVFTGIALNFQPQIIGPLTALSTTHLKYGPHPTTTAALVAFSPLLTLLACVPLFTAMRSCATPRIAIALLSPLALSALLQLGEVSRYPAGWTGVSAIAPFESFFSPRFALASLTGNLSRTSPTTAALIIPLESLKYLSLLAITLHLTHAQLLPRRHPTPSTPSVIPP